MDTSFMNPTTMYFMCCSNIFLYRHWLEEDCKVSFYFLFRLFIIKCGNNVTWVTYVLNYIVAVYVKVSRLICSKGKRILKRQRLIAYIIYLYIHAPASNKNHTHRVKNQQCKQKFARCIQHFKLQRYVILFGIMCYINKNNLY